MRKLLLIVLFLICASQASATCSNTAFGNWTCIQSATNFLNGAPITKAFTSNVGAGHLLIAMHSGCSPTAGCGGTTGLPVISDNLNGNWTCGYGIAQQPAPASARIGVCFFCGSAAGATTVTGTGGYTNFFALTIEEWSNSGGACFGTPIESPAIGQVTPGTTQLTTPATAFTNDLIYSVFFSTTASITVGGSWTITTTNNPATGNIYASAAQNGASATTYTTSWADSGSTPGPSVVLAFRFPTKSVPCTNTVYGNWNCVQTGSSNGTNTVFTPGNVGAGSLAVVFYTSCGSVDCSGGPFSIPTMTDNHSNSLTCPAAANSLFQGDNWGLCYLAGTTSGAFTVTMTSRNREQMMVQEWTNTLTGSLAGQTFDVGGVIGAAGTPCTTCAIATSGPTAGVNELVISGLFNGDYVSTDDGVFTYTAGSAQTDTSNGTVNILALIARNGPTVATYTTGWNALSHSPNSPFQRGAIATFTSPPAGVPRKHGIIIKFNPHQYRFPWIPKRKRISTI